AVRVPSGTTSSTRRPRNSSARKCFAIHPRTSRSESGVPTSLDKDELLDVEQDVSQIGPGTQRLGGGILARLLVEEGEGLRFFGGCRRTGEGRDVHAADAVACLGFLCG